MTKAICKKHYCRKIILALLVLGVFSLSFVKSPPPLDTATAPLPTQYADYHRGEDQTYLTFPEWYIVYSSDEYAQFLQNHRPSAFPYFSSIGQFWSGYWKVYQITKSRYPFNMGYHVMVAVIGTSLSVEYTIKGIYENTIGRLSEWTSTHGQTEEEVFAAKTAAEYVDFIRIYPWYEFDFAKKFFALWHETDFHGHDLIRKTERKFILSVEYAGKAGYGWVIKKLTYLSYEPESPFTVAQVSGLSPAILKQDPALRFIQSAPDHSQLIAMLRYDAFKNYATKLAKQHTEFQEISGNRDAILVTIITRKDWEYNLPKGQVAFSQAILTQPELKRLAIVMPVSFLSVALNTFAQKRIAIEHIYDY
jgi:hypothetical protein